MAERQERADSDVRPPAPEPLPVAVVDNHTHLDHERPEDVATLLAMAATAGVPRSVQIGCDLESARWTVRAVEEHPQLLGGVAVHPNEAPRLAASGELDDALREIEQLASHPRVRVVGETGLDYFRTDVDHAKAVAAQQESFRAHIEMAKRLGLALQIHDRDAHADVLRVLEEEGAPERTVFHCFSGDEGFARLCAERGWYLSFAGNVTFRNAPELRKAAAAAPPDLLVTETDTPYLSPHPHRGRPNEPARIPLIVAQLAELHGLSEEDMARVTSANARRLFALPPPS